MKEDWVEVSLGEVCYFVGGGTPSKKEPNYWNGNIPWASVKDIKGVFLDKTIDSITEFGLNNSSAKVALPGEIIIGTRIIPGRPIINRIQTAINQDLKIVKPLFPFDRTFLFFSFLNLRKEISKLSSGTTVLGINLNNLKSIFTSIPPLPIQRAIVTKIENLFTSLDKGIEDLKKAQEQLKVYRQAVLKKAFEGGYTQAGTKFIEESINDEKTMLPNTWTKTSLGSLVKLQGGYAFKSSEYTKQGIPIVKIKNVHIQDIDWTEKTFVDSNRAKEFKEFLLYEGDVLIAMTRPVIKSLNNVKTVVVKKQDLPALLNQRVGRFQIRGSLDKEFLKYFIFTEFFKKRVVKESSSSQQPNISSSKIERFDFILPESIEEQHQIVREIESRLSVCDKLEQSITEGLEKAEALRQSILKKAFEGKLLSEAEIEKCKQEADYEPASVLLERIKKENSS